MLFIETIWPYFPFFVRQKQQTMESFNYGLSILRKIVFFFTKICWGIKIAQATIFFSFFVCMYRVYNILDNFVRNETIIFQEKRPKLPTIHRSHFELFVYQNNL